MPATAHWMADVYADRLDTPLGTVLLPGAFNSSSYACDAAYGISPDAPEVVLGLWGSEDSEDNDAYRQLIVDWAKTQGRPLAQQLEDGIRFVELNITLKDGVVTTWHSVYGVPLAEVLEDVVAYSLAWPDEVIVVTFGVSLDAEDWPLLADELAAPLADGASFCDRVYDGPEPAAQVTFADVQARGRNLIWAPQGELRTFLTTQGCALSSGESDRAWSITTTPEGVEAALAASVPIRDPERLLINDFVFSLGGAASAGEQLGFLLTYSGVQEASTALGFAGDFPEQLIESYDADGQMNIFAGAYYEDTSLIEAAIRRNSTP